MIGHRMTSAQQFCSRKVRKPVIPMCLRFAYDVHKGKLTRVPASAVFTSVRTMTTIDLSSTFTDTSLTTSC